MNATEIRARLEQIERAIFFEQMADFMDWNLYYKLRAEQKELKEQLTKLEG